MSVGSLPILFGEHVKQPYFGALRHQLEPLGNSAVRFVVAMAAVPRLIAGLVGPTCQQPYFSGIFDGAHDLHVEKSRSRVHQMRTRLKRLPHRLVHGVANREAAERNEYRVLDAQMRSIRLSKVRYRVRGYADHVQFDSLSCDAAHRPWGCAKCPAAAPHLRGGLAAKATGLKSASASKRRPRR